MSQRVGSGALPAAIASAKPPFERGPRVVLSIVTLCGIGFSLALCGFVLALTRDERADFLIKNAIPASTRGRALAGLLAALLLPALLAGFGWLLGARRGRLQRFERRLVRGATMLSPLCLAFMVPLLFESRLALANPSMYLVLLSVFVVAFGFLSERAFAELASVRPPRWLAAGSAVSRATSAVRTRLAWFPLGIVLVTLGAAGYAWFGAYYAVQSHRLIQTTALDLGVYDNLMFNALHGRPFQSSLFLGPSPDSHFGFHGEYAMLVFAPLYALRPSPETLLILKAVLLGFAVIPLYLCARRFMTGLPPLVVAFAYLMFAPVHGSTMAAFHWLPLAIFFLFWAFYAVAANNYWLLVPSVLLLFALHEDVALGLCLLGVFLVATRARVTLGWALASVSALWFAFNNFWLVPRFGGAARSPSTDPFVARASLDGILVLLATNPSHALSDLLREAKLQYALHMLAPLAFLPLRKLAFVLLLVPGALASLASSASWPQMPSAFHSVAHFVPYVFLAAVLGLWLMQSEPGAGSRRAAALLTLVVVVLGHSHCYGALLQRENFQRSVLNAPPEMTRETRRRYEQLQSVVRRIPAEASVAATDYMGPHVSTRSQVFSFRQDLARADYILVSNREIHGENQRRLAAAFEKQQYGLVARVEEFFLFKRGHSSADTERAMSDLGVSSNSTSR